MAVEHAIIAGAGIAGLSAALSFAKAGIPSDIYEKAPHLTEVGAGLQIAPNASHILSTLGVLADLESVWNEPERIDLLSGIRLKRLASVPVGPYARNRWGAPYGVLHRATLQKALLAAVLREPACRLHLDTMIDPVASAPAAGDGRPQLVVGADGVWSRMRAVVPSCPIPAFSGNIAWRFTIPGADAPSFLDLSAVSAFLGPDAHIVAYPLTEIGGFNVVAITAGNSPGETWDASAGDVRLDLLLRRFSGWHADIRKMLEAANEPRFWPLYQASDGHWHNGVDTVLIGDAAHAMMPFAAQGAAMAIEDAFELARFAGGAMPLPAALEAFEAKRKPRIDRARKQAAFNRFAYHASGPVRIARDVVLSMRSPQSLSDSFDWLYGYRAA
ncbi:FAD-dependent monooxygenase [Rhizobiaceae bacterium BDR2-2]|uniref:FAD-dependent monooxygenase n=1 Tax=Ectorhizobium quercum TaxID=2965071 RepID=A0AAE3N2W2_9HYPH|nr:FAD-dependent monooxygenase [Ectorhizobium quercum]MCX8997607.1 FAD-dependent monooxygenase [Ectorhizobium quercum]